MKALKRTYTYLTPGPLGNENGLKGLGRGVLEVEIEGGVKATLIMKED